MELPSSCAEVLSSKSQIDRLGERLCESPSSTKALEDIQCFRLFRLLCMNTCLDILANIQMPDHSVLSIRLKRIPSIQRKIERSTTHLSQMDDIIGFRIICRSYAEAAELSSHIQSTPHHKRTKDYLTEPRDTGYRATHHIFEFLKNFPRSDKTLRVSFEVQVRSYYQHMWAIYSESFGEQAKEGAANSEIKNELSVMSDQVRKWEERHPSEIQEAKLPPRAATHQLAVVLMREGQSLDCYFFQQDYRSAFDQLMYWEMLSPKSRDNTLLLAGMATATEKDIKNVLQLTHPTYFGIRHSPQSWMPPT